MADSEFEYGKIFVKAATVATCEFVESHFGPPVERALWIVNGVEVEVRHNPDEATETDFIGWPTFVEIVPEGSGTSNGDVLTLARDLVTRFGAWSGGAVLASDYEDLL